MCRSRTMWQRVHGLFPFRHISPTNRDRFLRSPDACPGVRPLGLADGLIGADVLGRADRWLPLCRDLHPLIFSGIQSMSDVIFVVLGLGFFAGACLYLYACDRL